MFRRSLKYVTSFMIGTSSCQPCNNAARRFSSATVTKCLAAVHPHYCHSKKMENQKRFLQKVTNRSVIARCLASKVKKPERINVNFVTSAGDRYESWGYEGDSIYDVVINRNLPLDGFGACEATLACSTCHVIMELDDIRKAEYDLGMEPTDEELDMLDLAYGLEDTSRLGCQIVLCKELDGMTLKVPAAAADARFF